MADSEQQVVMLEGTHITDNGEIVTISNVNEDNGEEVVEDILQQALDGVSEGYDQNGVEYTTTENIAVVADSNGTLSDASGVTYSYVTSTATDTHIQNVQAVQTVQPGQSLIRISPQQQIAPVNQIVTLDNSSQAVVEQQHDQTTQHHVVAATPPGSGSGSLELPQQTHVQLTQSASGTPGAITVLTQSHGADGQPLGSSTNPIQIIQQGNQYTSMQQLTGEQLAQIMQVVQQQQLAKTTAQGGGSSVLFNPQTQTRIVYRVIYPSELHSKGSTATGGVSASSMVTHAKTITVPKNLLTLAGTRRTYKKRHKDEDDKVDGPELSKEEKELRKKHRPRTRSGRVSRPPKHMVQDYKHIHHLDWEEDYDDSDGGYSDYKVSDEEDGEGRGRRERSKDSYIETGLGSSKPKNHKCQSCEKAYIGAAGLARHYRLNPTHGNAEDIIQGNDSITGTSSDFFRMDQAELGEVNTNGVDGTVSLADDSSTQDSISSTASISTSMPTVSTSTTVVSVESDSVLPVTSPEKTTSTSTPIPTPLTTVPSRSTLKAKVAYQQDNTPARRKARLKELVRQCSDEELMEIVLPRLARVITVWEFLLMKVERGRPLRPHVGDVLGQYESIHKNVRKMSQEYLRPAPPTTVTDPLTGRVLPHSQHTNTIQLTNLAIAQSLGLSLNPYEILSIPHRDDVSLRYKFLTTERSASTTATTGNKRTIELVTPDELVVQNIAKKSRPTGGMVMTPSADSVMMVNISNGTGHTDQDVSGNDSTMDRANGADMIQSDRTSQDEPADSLAGVGVTYPEPVQNLIKASLDSEAEAHTVTVDDTGRIDLTDHHSQTASVIKPDGEQSSGKDGHRQNVVVKQQGHHALAVEIGVNAPSKDGLGADTRQVLHGQVIVQDSSNTSHMELNAAERVEQGRLDEKQQLEPTEQSVTSEDAETSLPTDSSKDVIKVNEQNQIVSVNGEVSMQQGSTPITDGDQMVVLTSDNGQTFIQADHLKESTMETNQVVRQVEDEQEVTMETGQQLVSMETPEGLVQGQLITNEDGTQYIIQHQEPVPEQQMTVAGIYQTPEGLVLIQNADGTFRIHSQGDQPIPLETVQALLAMDGDSQVQVEEGGLQEATLQEHS